MDSDSGFRKVTSLKTYSRRVKKSSSTPAAKNTSQADSFHKAVSLSGVQRSILGVFDENHSHVLSLQKKQEHANDATLSNTSATSQRQALSEIDLNQLRGSNSVALLKHSQKGGSSSRYTTSFVHSLQIPQSEHNNKEILDHYSGTTPYCNSHTDNSALPVSDKGIVSTVSVYSPPDTRQNEQDLPAKSSYPVINQPSVLESLTPHLENEQSLPSKTFHLVTEERPVIESVTPHLAKPSKKRKRLDSNSPESKKVKRSTIKSYFKPLPTSSSPPVARSTNIFSDEIDPPLSPPTSPNSVGESLKYRPSRKKTTRRKISLKPSLAPPLIMDYEAKHDVTLDGVVGEMDDDTQAQNTKLFKKSKDQIDLNYRCLNEAVPHSEPIDIPKKSKNPMKFQQTRIMALMDTRFVCQECDMMYDRTIPEEVRDHLVMHQRLTHPHHPGKGILDNPIFEQRSFNGIHRVHVNRRDAERKERDWYEHALELSESNGLGLFEGQLWREIFIGEASAPTHGGKGSGETKEKPRRKAPQYKIYVYTIDYAIASVALVQRIAVAGAYYHGPKTHNETGKLATPELKEDQNYVNMDRIFPVLASIDRLWTGVGYRREGYATTLLDCVRKDFIHSIALGKHQVAFSLPTTEGEAFATKYFTSVFPGCPYVVGREEARYVVEDGVLKDLLEVEPKLEKKLSSDSLIFRISL